MENDNNFIIKYRCKDTKARVGLLKTKHGDIETPFFMPVATAGAVKAITNKMLEELNAEIVLSNTYHLYLRPGIDIIKQFGGLHNFMNWNKLLLTDSGGYQIFSMAQLSKVNTDGVMFQSHIDGSTHFITPEKIIEMQQIIGADIIMVIDECLPYPASYSDAKNSLSLTLSWAKRCKIAHTNQEQLLFGIIQGSIYKDLRKICIEELVPMDFDGYAIGGLSVGEPAELLMEIAAYCANILPAEKPIYLMGTGTPADIIKAVAAGIDMFDCVLPTRNARNGFLFTSKGKILIKNQKYKFDNKPIDESCNCYTCKNFSRAYLRHLFLSKEYNSAILNSIHNLYFYLNLMKNIRTSIINGTFNQFAKNFTNEYNLQNELDDIWEE
jgi:queuine tRNA-ribosyltransferase